MSYNFGSGNFSSQSFGGFWRPTVSACNSVYPTNVVIIPLKTYQLGCSICGGQQESFFKPISNQTSCTGTRSFQTSCFRPNNFISSPCQTNYTGSLGYGSTGFGSFGNFNNGFGSCAHRNTAVQYLGSSFYRPSYFSTRSFQ